MWQSDDSVWELLPFSQHMEPRGRAQTLTFGSNPSACRAFSPAQLALTWLEIRALCNSLVIPLARLKHAPLGGVVLILFTAISF